MTLHITGIGITSALGKGIEANWQATQTNISGITYSKAYTEDYDPKVLLAQITFEEVGDKRFFNIVDSAFAEAVSDAGLSEDELKRTALIFAQGSPDNAFIIREGERLEKTGRARPDTVYTIMHSHMAAELARKYKIDAAAISNSAACAGSAQAIHLGKALIESGMVDRCICGGGEVIDVFTHQAFKSMRFVLTPSKDADTAVQPFGAQRSGIVLGEAAGFVVLESEQSMHTRSAKSYAKLTGSSYQNVPSAMFGDIPEEHIWCDLIAQTHGASEAQYVIAHATSTPKGDAVEGKAIIQALPEAKVASFKGLFGHTLSASSVIDIVLLMQGFKSQTMPGFGADYALEDGLDALQLLRTPMSAKFDQAIKLSAGFGGGLSCLAFAKP